MPNRNRANPLREPHKWLAAAMLLTVACTGCGHKRRAKRTPPAPQPQTARTPAIPAPVGSIEEGLASWYGIPYHGRQAADGEIYDMEKLTAAHRTLPFQTWVHVTNLSNGRTVDVRIIDRGPFVEGRIIDLSKAAAREIELLGPGVGPVRLEVINPPVRLPAHVPATAEVASASTSPSSTVAANAPVTATIPSTAGNQAGQVPFAGTDEAGQGASSTQRGNEPTPPAAAAIPQTPPVTATQPPAASGPRFTAPAVPLPPDTIAGRNLYAVQVGVFAIYENALRLRDLCTKSYAPAQLVIRQGARPTWRVLVGSFENEADAQQLAQRIRAERNEVVFVVHLDPPAPGVSRGNVQPQGSGRNPAAPPAVEANPNR